MTRFQKTAALAAALTSIACSAQAEAASLDTADDIAAVMQACVVITSSHDYVAEGQDIDIPWNRITERSAGFGLQDAPANVSANVSRFGSSGNSYCDFLFTDEDLAKSAFALFTQNNEVITLDDRTGICDGGQFIVVEVTGPDGPLASSMGKQGHITVHNTPGSTNDPCTG